MFTKKAVQRKNYRPRDDDDDSSSDESSTSLISDTYTSDEEDDDCYSYETDDEDETVGDSNYDNDNEEDHDEDDDGHEDMDDESTLNVPIEIQCPELPTTAQQVQGKEDDIAIDKRHLLPVRELSQSRLLKKAVQAKKGGKKKFLSLAGVGGIVTKLLYRNIDNEEKNQDLNAMNHLHEQFAQTSGVDRRDGDDDDLLPSSSSNKKNNNKLHISVPCGKRTKISNRRRRVLMNRHRQQAISDITMSSL